MPILFFTSKPPPPPEQAPFEPPDMLAEHLDLQRSLGMSFSSDELAQIYRFEQSLSSVSGNSDVIASLQALYGPLEEDTEHDPYVYPGTKILINRFNVRDAALLQRMEAFCTTIRSDRGLSFGTYSESNLREAHKELYSDIYPWAGELRSTHWTTEGWGSCDPREISGELFAFHHRVKDRYASLCIDRDLFATQAADIFREFAAIAPFRHGNALLGIELMIDIALASGYDIDRTVLSRGWSAELPQAETPQVRLADVIDSAIIREPERGGAPQNERDWAAACRDVFAPSVEAEIGEEPTPERTPHIGR